MTLQLANLYYPSYELFTYLKFACKVTSYNLIHAVVFVAKSTRITLACNYFNLKQGFPELKCIV